MNFGHWTWTTLIALSAALVFQAIGAEDTPSELEPTSDRRQEVLYGEPVERVYAPKIDSWRAIDNQRLLLYVTPFKPYLVTLKRRVNTLNWEYKIGLDNRMSYIDARFDRVYVDGFPYAIKRIEKLSRATAKALVRRDRGKDDDDKTEPEAGQEEQREDAEAAEQEDS